MKTTIISCDSCCKDLIGRSRLDLTEEFTDKVYPRGAMVATSDIVDIPLIKNDVCFCNIKCLKRWISSTYG